MKRLLSLFLICHCLQLTAQVQVTVDPTKEYQRIDGFGAFGGIKAYWESPPFFTEPFLDYFLDDLGSTIVRTNIFWDLEPQNDNSSSAVLDLSKFNYKAGSNLARQLPYYKALKAAGLQKLIATSWTPPDWMKLHDDDSRIPKECYNCNNCPMSDPRRKVCGGRLDPKYYGEYAEYLLAYAKILKQEADIDLYGISIQNEPWFANPFESNVVRPEEYGVLLSVVGRKFREAGLATKIFGPEHMAEWSWGVQKNYVNNIFKDGNDNPYLDIYAVHGYVDGVAPDFGSAEGWTALKENISDAYGKPLWMTETSGYPQTFQGAMNLAKSMYLAFRFGQISAWVYWSVSGEPGSEFSLMANGEPTIVYYASKQYFKYIRPGARRIEVESGDADVLPLAFQNPSDGSMTILLINVGNTAKDISLNVSKRPTNFTVYRTSATENCEEVGTVTNSVTLPAASITTLVGYGSVGPSLNEIADQYFKVGDENAREISLNGISSGDGTTLQITATSSNESVVSVSNVIYSYPSAEGKLVIQPNTSSPGKATITVTLDNGSDPSSFGFSTNTITFDVVIADVITGSKKKVSSEVAIYPNPVQHDILTVDLSGVSRPHSFFIKDVHGKTIFKLDDDAVIGQSVDVRTTGWPAGVYYVEMCSDQGRIVEKIVVR